MKTMKICALGKIDIDSLQRPKLALKTYYGQLNQTTQLGRAASTPSNEIHQKSENMS